MIMNTDQHVHRISLAKCLGITVIIFIFLGSVYTGLFVSLRRAEILDLQGRWMLYFYNDAFVRQYAVDDQARLLFSNAVAAGDRSFFAGKEGATGKNWFCVYRKPGTMSYRIFRLAEEIENYLKRNLPADTTLGKRRPRVRNL
jgi:hypothetical protein